MKPITFKGVNARFGESQDEYRVLPAMVVGDKEGTVITCWQLTPEEKEIVAKNGCFYLTQLTFNNPLQPLLPVTELADMYYISEEEKEAGRQEMLKEKQESQKEKLSQESLREALSVVEDILNNSGVGCIATEREQQIHKHGWTVEHDVEHHFKEKELLLVAMFCLTGDNKYRQPHWTETENKIMNKDAVGKLAVAGAFISAHIDCLKYIERNKDQNQTKEG